jgi:hypothetical protein
MKEAGSLCFQGFIPIRLRLDISAKISTDQKQRRIRTISSTGFLGHKHQENVVSFDRGISRLLIIHS